MADADGLNPSAQLRAWGFESPSGHLVLICFDLDGVIADSFAGIVMSINHTLAEIGQPSEPGDQLGWFVGPPLQVGWERLCLQRGLPPTIAPDLVQVYRRDYWAHCVERTPAFDGVAELIRSLIGGELVTDADVAVVTSKAQPVALDIVQNLVGTIDVYGPSLRSPSEPKTETLRRALEELRPNMAIMVGDRSHDIDAATANGILSIGVTWGFGDRAELEGARPDSIVNTPAELADTLVSFAR